MQLSEKIYTLRKRQGMSQEDLANALDVSRQSISNWETGTAKPEIGKLAPLAKILSVSVDFLLDEEAEIVDFQTGNGHKQTTSMEAGAETNEAEAKASKSGTDPDDTKTFNSLNTKAHSEEDGEKGQKADEHRYPSWLDNFPKFLQTGIYRYGWLYGIHLALYGLGLSIFGVIGKLMINSYVKNTVPSDFGNDILITPDNLPPEAIDAIKEELGYQAPPANRTMSIIPNTALIIGIIVIIIGVVLALELKEWGEQQEKK